MASSAVPEYRCGTTFTTWMNGAHPTVADGKVTAGLCVTVNLIFGVSGEITSRL
jgi:hypothetical protein